MTDAVEFTRADIEELLTALAARLEAQGVAATVYLVGGAAIALRGISTDRRTADVDACYCPRNRYWRRPARSLQNGESAPLG